MQISLNPKPNHLTLKAKFYHGPMDGLVMDLDKDQTYIMFPKPNHRYDLDIEYVKRGYCRKPGTLEITAMNFVYLPRANEYLS